MKKGDLMAQNETIFFQESQRRPCHWPNWNHLLQNYSENTTEATKMHQPIKIVCNEWASLLQFIYTCKYAYQEVGICEYETFLEVNIKTRVNQRGRKGLTKIAFASSFLVLSVF